MVPPAPTNLNGEIIMTSIQTENPVKITLERDVSFPKSMTPDLFASATPGDFVSIRLASEKETHLGIYLGDMPGIGYRYNDDKTELTIVRMGALMANPVMFVPKLGRLVYGFESWWGTINTPEDLRAITDEDIDGVWYVQALKSLEGKKQES